MIHRRSSHSTSLYHHSFCLFQGRESLKCKITSASFYLFVRFLHVWHQHTIIFICHRFSFTLSYWSIPEWLLYCTLQSGLSTFTLFFIFVYPSPPPTTQFPFNTTPLSFGFLVSVLLQTTQVPVLLFVPMILNYSLSVLLCLLQLPSHPRSITC